MLNTTICTNLASMLQKASPNKAKAAAFKSTISTIFLLWKLENIFGIIAKYSRTRIPSVWKEYFHFQKELQELTNTTAKSSLPIMFCSVQGLDKKNLDPDSLRYCASTLQEPVSVFKQAPGKPDNVRKTEALAVPWKPRNRGIEWLTHRRISGRSASSSKISRTVN